MRVRYDWKILLTFAFAIALPLIFASLGVATLTFDLLARVSTGANTEDRQRTWQIVESALSAIQQQLANTATDNSHWDDAVRKLYGTANKAWLAETYSVPTEDGVNYDALLVVDRDVPNALAGLRKGQPFTPTTESYFFSKLALVLDRLPKDNKTFDAAAAIVNTTDGLAVVAAAPILPLSKDFEVLVAKPRYFVFVKYLTPEYLAGIGRQYVIHDLRMTAGGGAGANGEVVKDLSGAPVATVQWTDRRPGDIARAAVLQTTIVVLGFLAAVMLGIAIVCWRLIRRIARREAEAHHDASHDALTGLPNRTALYAEIDTLLKAGCETIAVAFADLDGFKDVNDTYDHETGDQLICRVAASLPGPHRGRGHGVPAGR